MSGSFAMYSGRTAMPKPLRARSSCTPGSLTSTLNKMFWRYDLHTPRQPPDSRTDARMGHESIRRTGLPCNARYSGLANSALFAPG